MVNTAPVANDDDIFDGSYIYSINEGSVLRVNGANGVLKNDTDADGDGLAAYVSILPENPLFQLRTTGAFIYDARYPGQIYVDSSTNTLTDDSAKTSLPNGFDSLAEGAVIYDTFDYTATDGQASDGATATIRIVGVNDAPVADDELNEVVASDDADRAITIDVLTGDTDVDIYPTPDVLSVTALSDIDDEPGAPGSGGSDDDDGGIIQIVTDAGGTVTVNGDGTLNYQAAAGFFGIDTFEYTLSDGKGGTDTGLVRVTVMPANTGPTANNDSRSVDEDDGDTALASVLGNDTDPDDGGFEPIGAYVTYDAGTQVLSDILYASDASGNDISDPTQPLGLLTDFNADGTFSYNPNGAFNALALGETVYVSFQYTAFDGAGEESTAIVTIAVNGENDAPSASPAVETVYEAGLSDGSGAGLPASFPTDETAIKVVGTISATDPDGTDQLSITEVDGDAVPLDGIITGPGYKLTINGLSYIYELTDNRTTHSTQGMDDDDVKNVFVLTISDDNGPGSLTTTTTLTVNIFDDQPAIDPGFSVGTITHDETPGIGDGTSNDAGANYAEVTDIISGLSGPTGAITPGADGIGTPVIELTDSSGSAFNGTATNLIDTATGNRIFLYDNAGVIEGRVGTSDDASTGADATGDLAFTFELTNADADGADGKLTQLRAVYHGTATDPNDTVTLKSADGTADLIYVKVTVDDGDTGTTDTVSQVSSAAVGIVFRDDAPALTSIESGYVDFKVATSEGASTGLDFGFDGAGEVDLIYFTPSVVVKDLDGDTRLTLTGTETSDNTVTYSAGGTDYFEFTLDPNTGDYTMEVLTSAPPVSNQVLFDSVTAGSPLGRYEFATETDTRVGFSAYSGVSDAGGNQDDITPDNNPGDIKIAILAGNASLTVNPSEQGFGGGNNNTDPGEAYVIDTVNDDGAVQTSGIIFDIGKATGGITGVSFKWEAYSNGELVAEGTIPATSVPKPGAADKPISIELSGGVTADTYYILPEINSNKGAFAITKVEILESGALDDFAFDFTAVAIDADGDKTADVDFTIGVDGADDGYTGPGGTLFELDLI